MKQLVNYLREAQVEFGKVTWPSRPQAIRLTGAVIVFALIFAALAGALDWGFSQLLQRLILGS